jgi:hypothetical protein
MGCLGARRHGSSEYADLALMFIRESGTNKEPYLWHWQEQQVIMMKKKLENDQL